MPMVLDASFQGRGSVSKAGTLDASNIAHEPVSRGQSARPGKTQFRLLVRLDRTELVTRGVTDGEQKQGRSENQELAAHLFPAPQTGLRSEDLTLMLIRLCYSQRFWGPVNELPREPAGNCRSSHYRKDVS